MKTRDFFEHAPIDYCKTTVTVGWIKLFCSTRQPCGWSGAVNLLLHTVT